ncbi:MAG: glycogen-binding domain-containing protein [Lentisphaerota bacterium]
MATRTIVKNASTPERKKVVFEVQTRPGNSVFLAGDFNDWDCTARQLTDKNNNGLFHCAVMLGTGTFEYKYYINDIWCIDPANHNFMQNEMGTLNSVITVS